MYRKYRIHSTRKLPEKLLFLETIFFSYSYKHIKLHDHTIFDTLTTLLRDIYYGLQFKTYSTLKINKSK